MKRLSTTRKPGRPSVRTEDVARLLCKAIERGHPFVTACGMAGISYESFKQWRRADENFKERIDVALAKGVDVHISRIEEASKAGDWRASAFLLQHSYGQQQVGKDRTGGRNGSVSVENVNVVVYLPKKNPIPFQFTDRAAIQLPEGNPDSTPDDTEGNSLDDEF